MKQSTLFLIYVRVGRFFFFTKYAAALLPSLCIVTTIFSQAKVSGSFQSMPSASFSIVANQSGLNDYRGETLAEGMTNANGDFSASFALDREQPVLLFISNRFLRLWVIPFSTLTIKERSHELIFSGTASEENNFLFRTGIMEPFKVPGKISSTSFAPVQQASYLDSIEQNRWHLYNQENNKQFSHSFASYCGGEITGFTCFNKNQYALQHIFGQHKIKQEDIPTGYYSFWDKFQLLDDSCVSESYQNALVDYSGYLATRRLHLFNDFPDKEKYNQAELDILDSLLAHYPITREKIKGEKLIFILTYFDLPQLVAQQLKNYAEEFPASRYTAVIQKKYEAKNKIAFSQPSFILKDTSGKAFDIKMLRGKVVYIDFWGSWCKACLEQLPNAIRLAEEFRNSEVVFLYIDFYDSKKNWLRAIAERKIPGIHVKAEQEDESYFTEKFGIAQGFPRYALIDKTGALITTAAPGPGDKDAAELIRRYLQ